MSTLIYTIHENNDPSSPENAVIPRFRVFYILITKLSIGAFWGTPKIGWLLTRVLGLNSPFLV